MSPMVLTIFIISSFATIYAAILYKRPWPDEWKWFGELLGGAVVLIALIALEYSLDQMIYWSRVTAVLFAAYAIPRAIGQGVKIKINNIKTRTRNIPYPTREV